MATGAFQGTVFLNYFGDTDITSANYTPGRFLIASNAPNRKQPKITKSKTEKKTLPRIDSKAKTLFDGFREFPPEKIDRDNAEAVGELHAGIHETDAAPKQAEPEAVDGFAAAGLAQRRGQPASPAAQVSQSREAGRY